MSPFNWLDVKAQARGIVHETFRVAATYQDANLIDPVPLHVRWHNRIARFGDLDSQGYAQVLEGIERLIFSRDELATLGVSLHYQGVVSLSDARYQGAQFWLDSREPTVGPVEEIWEVTRPT